MTAFIDTLKKYQLEPDEPKTVTVEKSETKYRPPSPHYQQDGIEPIEYIMSHNMNFNIGNVIKYVTRAGKKQGEPIEKDLQKAIDYLKFELERVKK